MRTEAELKELPPNEWFLWRRPTGALFHVAVASLACALLWAHSGPSVDLPLWIPVVLLACLLAVVWAVRLVTFLVALARGRSAGSGAAWLVAPACGLAVLVLIVGGVPLQARWMVSRPAFETVVEQRLEGGGRWPARPGRLGLYDVDRVDDLDGGLLFSVRGDDLLGPSGFAPSRAAPVPISRSAAPARSASSRSVARGTRGRRPTTEAPTTGASPGGRAALAVGCRDAQPRPGGDSMEIDAGAAGFDAARLARIDEHLNRSYVEPGKIAGCQTLVARRGRVAHLSSLGSMDLERGRPVRDDTIWRLYSMTKPITGVALMTLYERGYFQLDDPVHRFVPSWRDIKVGEHDADGSIRLVDPVRPPTVRHVLMHTAGLGYGPANADLALPEPGSGNRGFTTDRYESLEALVDELAGAPLRFHPGTHWLYSFGTDVCARLVEIISGTRFDQYLQQEVLDPLGMVDTGFVVGDDDVERFATGYGRNSKKQLVVVDDPDESPYRKPRSFLSGGGGLVGTTADYLRLCQMLLGGGALDGVRILAPRTVELMAVNHLPGGGQLADVARPGAYGEIGFEGMGFGLTMAVSRGPAETGVSGTPGELTWGGAASTTFWVAPVDELVVVFMTQLIPSGTFNFRGQLKALVNGAMTG